MLKTVILKDFFSFHNEVKISLNEGANLLLGLNGSGKTSFINALRLLTEGVYGNGIENLIQTQWGGYSQILNCNGKEKAFGIQLTYVFSEKTINNIFFPESFESDVYYRITICPYGPTDYYLDETIWTTSNTKDKIYLDFHNGKGKLLEKPWTDIEIFQDYERGINGHELVIKQISDPNQYPFLHLIKNAIESIAVYNSFNTGESSNIRQLTKYSTDIRLWKDGENLTQILNNLKNNYSLDFDRIEDELIKVNPAYKHIEINNITGQSYLSLREKNLNMTIGALHISDGTLRFLLLEAIFLNPNRGNVIAIDEPERGLHPDMIRSVSEMIKEAAKNTQLIIATHSPHLLNYFDLEDVLVFEKNDYNSSTVKILSELDFSDLDDELLPGQLWLNGEIGGKRW